MTPEEQETLEKLLRELKRKLGQLELTKARKGFSTEPYIILEIEDTKKEIKELERQLADAAILNQTQTVGSVHKPTLTHEQLGQLVNLLVEFPSFKDPASRINLMAELSYQGHIRLSNTLRPDAISILRTASNFENGLQELASILELFDGESMILKKFREHINQLTQS